METESPGAGEEKNIVQLPKEMLGGMQVKEGDKLTFCVTGMGGADGSVSGYFEPMGEGEGDEKEGDDPDYSEDYAAGLRKEMSPRTETESVM